MRAAAYGSENRRQTARLAAVAVEALLVVAGLFAIFELVSFAAGRWESPYGSSLSVMQRMSPLAVSAVGVLAVILVRRRLVHHPRRRALSLALYVVAGVSVCLALFPQQSPQSARTCVPLFDAWHKSAPVPTRADIAAYHAVHDPLANPSALVDKVKRQELLAAAGTEKATPEYRAAARYYAWTFGPGPCGPGGRGRLLLTLAIFGAGTSAVCVLSRPRLVHAAA